MAATNNRRTAALLGLALAGTAAADEYTAFSVHHYDLKPGLTITKPAVLVARDFSASTSLTLRLAVDDVAARGADAVSGASQYAAATTGDYTDTRKEIAAGLTHAVGPWRIEAGYLLSVEKDYRSAAPSLVLSRDLFQRNTTVGVGYAHQNDEIMGSYLPVSQQKDGDSYLLSLTQVLGRGTVIQAAYTYSDASGYMGTGNRRVGLTNGMEMDEYLPQARTRKAAGVRLAQWLPTEGSLHLTYQRYSDDWEIDAGTYGIHLYQQLGSALLARLEYRHYVQDSAWFVKDSYSGLEKYLASASSLRAFSSDLYGVKLGYTLKQPADAVVEGKYERYRQSTGLEGDIFMLGIRLPF